MARWPLRSMNSTAARAFGPMLSSGNSPASSKCPPEMIHTRLSSTGIQIATAAVLQIESVKVVK